MTRPLKLSLCVLLAAGGLQLSQSQSMAAQAEPPVATQASSFADDPRALPSGIGKAVESALLPPATKSQPQDADKSSAALQAACTPAEFGSRTGSALVSFVKASTVECINSILFNVSGSNAYNIFRELQMVTIAYAMRDTSYPGNNSTSVGQLVQFLRAGYFVQSNHSAAVGQYGPALKTAIRAALDTFYANPRTRDVTDDNGRVLGEAVTLIDSAQENARYLYVVRRLLTAFDSQYNDLWYMRGAVNNTFTVLFRGHWVPEFNQAVAADPSILDVVNNFANTHFSLLSTDSGFLIANAGGELTRFLDNAPLVSKVRPMARALLNRSSMTGPTGVLWLRVADVATYHDGANCAYYDVCDFKDRLEAEVLPIRHQCNSLAVVIRAQQISTTNLNAACTSMRGQVPYFHNLVRSNGVPVANDYNTSLEVVAFHSSTDYKTYAGVMFGIDTNNGGMYLEGNPANPNNIARFIAHEAEWLRPAFHIWNLNHEFTHYLDGRFNMYGDFQRTISVPNIWWVEGFAEVVSFHYRGVTYDAAIAEARKHTFRLSTLWNTTYEPFDVNRIYRWGYLASRYMLERHPSDVYAILAKFRANDYNGAYSLYRTGIGTRYDADFDAWLDNLSNTPATPTANFTFTVNGLTANFTDTSTGSITSRSWNFGDGTSSTTTNPTKTYTSAGTYTVTLTVTGPGGGHTKSASVTVNSGPSGCPPENYLMADNCTRTGLSGPQGALAYYSIYLPAGVTLRINTSGGTGDVDIYYHPSSWASNTNYTASSTGSGNTDQITITNTTAGWRYITLYGYTAYSAVTFTTTY